MSFSISQDPSQIHSSSPQELSSTPTKGDGPRLSATFSPNQPPVAKDFLAVPKSSTEHTEKAKPETEKAGKLERALVRPFLALAKLAISVAATGVALLAAVFAGGTAPSIIGLVLFGAVGVGAAWIADTAFKSMVNDITIIAKGQTLKEVSHDSYFLRDFMDFGDDSSDTPASSEPLKK
jgi:predicted ATPase